MARDKIRIFQIILKLTKKERDLWKEQSLKLDTSLSEFIRNTVNRTFQKTDQNNSNELKATIGELKNLVQLLTNVINLNKDPILDQIALRALDEKPLEEKIMVHLKGRSLLVPRLSEYCDEDPTKVLSELAIMRKKGIVNQDSQMRWFLL
jgi:hypothetical protein